MHHASADERGTVETGSCGTRRPESTASACACRALLTAACPPRTPFARSSATNRLIEANDKASIQLNIGHVNGALMAVMAWLVASGGVCNARPSLATVGHW